MASKRKKLDAKLAYHRPIITDVLPFEVPPSFSNGGFFHFLTQYDVRIIQKGDDRWVKWSSSSTDVDPVIALIFGTASKNPGSTHDPNTYSSVVEVVDGKSRTLRSWRLGSQWTRPFHFNISHKEKDFRQLTVIHPRNQLLVADFYNRNSAQILYHCQKSDFSIRRPASVARLTKFADRLHHSRKPDGDEAIEILNKEHDSLGSYFVYKSYSNIFKFYEHYKYHNAERKFDRLLKLDISKCFDSIYTHSLPWTVLGVEATKAQLKLSTKTFGGRFDTLFQEMNQGETNGIVIGPEFSRIFAEIILQGVDKKLQAQLLEFDGKRSRVDYEVFRYVDDYFIFYNSEATAEGIERRLAALLKEVKLGLNVGKSNTFEKPIITQLTIAKNRVRDVLARNIENVERICIDPKDSAKSIIRYHTSVRANALIVDFKTVLAETKIAYKDILNYTFSAIERSVAKIFNLYDKNLVDFKDPKQLTRVLIALLEFCFFVYAAAPRVNFSVRLTRIVSTMVDRLNAAGISRDLKSQVFKFAFDNIVRQLKNGSQKQFREVETLYLILAVRKLGRDYCIPEETLASYFGISQDAKGSYERGIPMDYFSVTVALLYMGGRKRYAKLRAFIESDVCKTFSRRAAYTTNDAELMMLFLDLQCCPYISQETLKYLDWHFLPYVGDLSFLKSASKYWFTNWENFDLSIELDMKRTREVY